MGGLGESIAALAVETGFSGVVRVDSGSEVLVSSAFGLAHRGFRVPNTTGTQFAIASGGKAFTALAVMSLVNDGIIGLDTTARTVLGDDLPLIADDVTVEHLLAHRSGIGDYLDEEDDSLDLDAYVLDTPVQRLDTTEAFLPELEGHPTKFPAGERFSYSNGGYMVLALIAERASGKSYHDLVTERVVRPAGMTDTAFLRSDEPMERMAAGYLSGEGLRTNVFHLPVRGNGDGGIYTTVDDVHVFWRALLSGRIVPLEVVQQMTRAHSDVPAESMRYGLGFWLAPTGSSLRLVGGDAGVSFSTCHDPDVGAAWTVISNTTTGAWPLTRFLLDDMERAAEP